MLETKLFLGERTHADRSEDSRTRKKSVTTGNVKMIQPNIPLFGSTWETEHLWMQNTLCCSSYRLILLRFFQISCVELYSSISSEYSGWVNVCEFHHFFRQIADCHSLWTVHIVCLLLLCRECKNHRTSAITANVIDKHMWKQRYIIIVHELDNET